jgi:hypothetical protein
LNDLKKLLTLILLTVLIGCTEEYGDKAVGGNLSVYYLNEKDADLASDLVYFYRDNDLIASEPHQMQISRSGKKYLVSIIAQDEKQVKNMSFEERKALFDLQTMIRDSVFKDKKVELIICDNQFKPILNINK